MQITRARILLDPDAMAALFAALPALEGRSVQSATLVSLWVKPGRHFNACYRLHLGNPDETLLASAFAVGRTRAASVLSDMSRHCAGAPNGTCPHCSSAVVPPGMLLQMFPFDYRLPTLPACLDASHVTRFLGEPIALGAGEPVGYRPGMRCQIRYAGAIARYGKVAVEREPGRAFVVQQRVRTAAAADRCSFAVAEPLAYLANLQLTLVAGATGRSLYDLRRAGRDVDAEVRSAAHALGDFHRLRVHGIERVYPPAEELELARAWTAVVAEMYPDLAAALDARAGDLTRVLPDPLAPRGLVHRDFYDKQVLLDSAALTLVDMDTVCLGDPEIDLGNFCAHLRLRGLQFERTADSGRLREGFLAAYPRRFAVERVVWYERAALLRLACYYALRPHWHHLAPALLAEGGGR